MAAGGDNDWLELVKSKDFHAWTSVKVQECNHEVRQQDDQRKSMVQQILQKSADFRRRIIAPVGGQGGGGVTLSYVCPYVCHRFPTGDHIWWVSTRHGQKQCKWWCAACGQCNWKNPNSVSAIRDSTDRSEANMFRAHAPPQGACENLVCALKLLAQQQTRGDSPVQVLVEVLQEQSSLKMMDDLRKIHQGGQPRGEDRRLGEVLGGAPCGLDPTCTTKTFQMQRSAKGWKNC